MIKKQHNIRPVQLHLQLSALYYKLFCYVHSNIVMNDFPGSPSAGGFYRRIAPENICQSSSPTPIASATGSFAAASGPTAMLSLRLWEYISRCHGADTRVITSRALRPGRSGVRSASASPRTQPPHHGELARAALEVAAPSD